MSKRVIINADDFGISQGVNRGIAETHLNGILTSASLMVNMPHTQDAVQIIKRLPNLKIGLHISLTGGKPVSNREDIPHLVDKNGFFPKRGINLVWKVLYNGDKMLKEIAKEIRAQIKLMKAFGLNINHLDSHDHIHVFPSILDIVIQLAREYSIPRIRYPNQKFIYIFKNPSRLLKSYLLSVLTCCSKNKLNKNGVFTCDCFWGLVESGNLNEATLMAILKALPEGLNEIVCHPGYVDNELLKIFPVVYNWEEELKALTSSKVKSLIKDYGIELI